VRGDHRRRILLGRRKEMPEEGKRTGRRWIEKR
jgi:hypothetical protein